MKNAAENKAKELTTSYDKIYTYGEYLEFGVEEMLELIKGKIFKMSPAPKTCHQLVCGNLHLEIGNYFKKNRIVEYL